MVSGVQVDCRDFAVGRFMDRQALWPTPTNAATLHPLRNGGAGGGAFARISGATVGVVVYIGTWLHGTS